MASIPSHLDLPTNWNQYPQNARREHLQNEQTARELRTAIIEAFDLPESSGKSRQSFSKPQLAVLAGELMETEDES